MPITRSQAAASRRAESSDVTVQKPASEQQSSSHDSQVRAYKQQASRTSSGTASSGSSGSSVSTFILVVETVLTQPRFTLVTPALVQSHYKKRPLPTPDWNDARTIFADRKLSQVKIQKLNAYFRAPCNLHPLPTIDQITTASGHVYYYGFYVSDANIRDYAIHNNPKRIDRPETTSQDMRFFEYCLSDVMNDDYIITLKGALVTARHKELMPEIKEDVGEWVLVAVLLTTDDYECSYNPTNREIYEISRLLNRMPCWWEPEDHAYWW